MLGALLRAGLTDRLEVRLDGAPLVRLRSAENDTGFGDPTLGVKYRFLDAREGSWWPSLGLLPFVKLPIAREPIGSERVDFGLTALASVDLPWQLGLDANAGLIAIGQSNRDAFLLQEVVSASLSRQRHRRPGYRDPVLPDAARCPRRGRPDLVRRAWARLCVPCRGERAVRAVTGAAPCLTP